MVERWRGLGQNVSSLFGGAAQQRLLQRATRLLLVRLFGRVLGFGASLILARTLGAEDYGVYVYVLGWLAFARLLSQFGMGPHAVRRLSGFRAADRWGQLRSFLTTSRLLVAGTSAAVGGFVVITVEVVGVDAEMRSVFYAGCLALPVFALLDLTAAHLRGVLRVLASQSLESIAQQTAMVGLLLMVVLVPWDLDPLLAMWLRSTAGVLALACGWLLLRVAVPPTAGEGGRAVAVGEEVRASSPFLAGAVLGFAMNQADVLVLGALAGPLAAGLFVPAKRLTTLVHLGSEAVETWLGPKIAELHTAGRVDELQSLVRRGTRVALIFAVPVALTILVGGRWILARFGPDFEGATGALAVLVFGALGRAVIGPARLVLAMTGRQSEVAKLMAFYALGGVLALFWMVPHFAVAGAAMVVVASRLLWEIHLAVLLYRTLGVRSSLW